MTATSKIVIDADNGKVDAANKKTQDGFKRTAGEAAKVGTQIEKWGRQLAEKVAGLGAIIGVMRSVGQEVERQRTQAAGANRAVGGGALARAQSIRTLGLDKGPSGAEGANAAVLGAAGGTSVSDRDDLLASMASMDKKSRPSAQVASQAMDVYNTGLFSKEEVLAATAGKGAGLAKLRAQIAQREAALPQQAREELAFREQERVTSNAVNDATAGRGAGARAREGVEERFTAQNPLAGGFRNIVRTASGGALDLLEDEAVVGSGGSAMLRETNAILGRIAERVKVSPKPTFATTPESGP